MNILLYYLFIFWGGGRNPVACRILVPRPGIEPRLQHQKCRVLTTGPPGTRLDFESHGKSKFLCAVLMHVIFQECKNCVYLREDYISFCLEHCQELFTNLETHGP